MLAIFSPNFNLIGIKNIFSNGLICFIMMNHTMLVCRQIMPGGLLGWQYFLQIFNRPFENVSYLLKIIFFGL